MWASPLSSLSLHRKFYGNPDRAAGQDDDSLFALIWNAKD
jgi:hypothetical protein